MLIRNNQPNPALQANQKFRGLQIANKLKDLLTQDDTINLVAQKSQDERAKFLLSRVQTFIPEMFIGPFVKKNLVHDVVAVGFTHEKANMIWAFTVLGLHQEVKPLLRAEVLEHISRCGTIESKALTLGSLIKLDVCFEDMKELFSKEVVETLINLNIMTFSSETWEKIHEVLYSTSDTAEVKSTTLENHATNQQSASSAKDRIGLNYHSKRGQNWADIEDCSDIESP